MMLVTCYINPVTEKRAIEQGHLFVQSIMKDYEDIPNSNGMKVLRDVSLLEEALQNVVLRSITEDFWLKVIQATERQRVCALGTPGIGKSTTSYILIRLLLQAKKKVVYHHRYGGDKKNYFVYFFTPSTGKSDNIDVKVIAEPDFDSSDPSVDNESTYYIVDPGQTKDSCNPAARFKGKVVIVTSPDECHWGAREFIKKIGAGKQFPGTFRYFPVWTLQEILAAANYFPKNNNLSLSEDEIIQHFGVVGGVPRLIFEDTIEEIKAEQLRLISNLSPEDIEKFASDGFTVPSLYAENIPKGFLLSYQLAGDDNGTYKKAVVTLRSRNMYRIIAKKKNSKYGIL
jgi:energy-coupling factor transporter ATP-binding protein EcfA2